MMMLREIEYCEHELVNLLKIRDEASFHYLYDRYSAALYRVILDMVPDRAIAQDILQDTFFNIWNKVNTYDSSKGRLFTWMYNIARNLSRDMLRSKAHQNSKRNQMITETEHPDEKSLSIHLNTDKIGIDKLIAKLKPDHQTLINMYYLEGYTVRQIMEIKNIPLGTVKTRIRLALVQLRNYVK